eukprot:TRINITY_DN8914_c0_g1_i1.p1 TRINITY_DN8914_c0_g1~~TRINITY_DN8914_c0_g1_i1.p1  ORF type:complete len:198 (+),score=26.62 TRINITY_DN8914_c0_g1_i1:1-594(+)
MECMVAIANGSEEIETIAIIDTLRRSGATVTTASIHDHLLINGSRNIKIEADQLLSQIHTQTFDLIVLPGGLEGANNFAQCQLLTELLRTQKQQKRLIAAICASPAIVLAPLGLLGTRSTCYPSFFDRLGGSGVEGRVVYDTTEAVVTSQAPGTALEFALVLVGLLYGSEKAQEVGDAMLFEGFYRVVEVLNSCIKL